MMERATAKKKAAWGLILTLVLMSTALVVGCGGGGGGIASMGVPLGEHTATVLADGRILITGGRGSSSTAETQLYDLATDTWTSAANMAKPQYGHTVTLLNDARVLSVGKFSAEVYDPATDTWTSTGDMINPREKGHTATVLADGRVLVAGGPAIIDDTAKDTAFAELYDPSTGEWTATADMTETRTMHKALLLEDGRVLVVGGRTSELYDPTTGTWSSAGEFTEDDGVGFSVTLLQDGRVLVAGGTRPVTFGLGETFTRAELYDPSTGEWSSTGDMNGQRYGHTATLLNDGKVLVIEYTSAELYDPATGVWTEEGKMSRARGRAHTATLLEDGRVLIAGGAVVTVDKRSRRELSRKGIDSVEIYDPAKGW